jgi:vacuolar-type H+-ATPase subunit E/Vma4
MALDQLLAALERDAQGTAGTVLAGARTDADALRAEAEARITRRREALVAGRKSELDAATREAVARARRTTTEATLAARQRFLDRVFAAARDHLARAVDDDQFRAQLPGYLSDARAFIGDGPCSVRCRPELAALIRSHLGPDDRWTIQEDPAAGTGVRLIAGDGSVEIDNTLEARLARLRPRLSLEIMRAFEAPA